MSDLRHQRWTEKAAGALERRKANPMTNNSVELQDAIERTPYCPNCGEACLDPWHSPATAALSVSGDMRWQPIESAPDCEEGIIVCDAAKPKPTVGVARYMEGRWRGAHMGWGFVSEAIWPEPTHWMPLPEPPALSPQHKDA